MIHQFAVVGLVTGVIVAVVFAVPKLRNISLQFDLMAVQILVAAAVAAVESFAAAVVVVVAAVAVVQALQSISFLQDQLAPWLLEVLVVAESAVVEQVVAVATFAAVDAAIVLTRALQRASAAQATWLLPPFLIFLVPEQPAPPAVF